MDEHEKTVLRLLEDLEANQIPMMSIYNKMDKLVDPTEWIHKKSSIAISAHNANDLKVLKFEIEEKLIEMMEYYRVYIKPDEGKLLSECKSNTIVKELKWLEDLNVYECRGFVHPSQPLYTWLKGEE